MISSCWPIKRPVLATAFVAWLFLSATLSLSQNSSAVQDNPERQHALELYDQGKMVEAMPLLEKILADHPKDIVICERLAGATLSYSQTVSDPELQKKARIRARALYLRAKDLGDNSNLLQTMLALIPEDGSQITFSAKKEVDEVMQRAEADFARGDFDKARDEYAQALLLDPNLYAAALFSGDTFFKQHKPGFAGEWFARAIEIDPNRETAYRYWGDSLKAEGKMVEAREKFIDAVIADPYNRNPWMGINQWADANHVKLNFIRLQEHGAVAAKDGKINITLDSSISADDPASAAWVAYSMERALWLGDKFKSEFPNEPGYRHTMREEVSALHVMTSVISEQKNAKSKSKGPDLDPSLAALVKIDRAGLLEPFVFFNRADSSIAQEYAAYRAANRDRLHRYLDEIVVPKTPQ